MAQVYDLDTNIDVIKHHGSTDPLILVGILMHHGIAKEEVRAARHTAAHLWPRFDHGDHRFYCCPSHCMRYRRILSADACISRTTHVCASACKFASSLRPLVPARAALLSCTGQRTPPACAWAVQRAIVVQRSCWGVPQSASACRPCR